MKRTLISTLLVCAVCGVLCAPAIAQTPAPATPASFAADSDEAGGTHQHGGGILRRLTDSLELSGTQEAAVAQILEAAKPQLKAIREKEKADIDALIDSVSNQITPLLSPGQQTTFSAMVQNLKNGPAKGGGAAETATGTSDAAPAGSAAAAPVAGGAVQKKHGGAQSPEAQLQRMTAALGLTADQQRQIMPILVSARARVKSIFANDSLTQEQKFTQFKAAMESANSQINGILTQPQQAEFAAMKVKLHHHLRGQGEAAASPAASGATN